MLMRVFFVISFNDIFMLFYFLKAWLIGISVAAPVGPIGMLCIRKTLEFGFMGAIAVGLGAALADSVYGLIAALSLTAILHFLLINIVIIKILGGIFLLYLAYIELKNETNHSKAALDKNNNLGRLSSSVFFLTLSNPMTILSFIGIFATIGSGIVMSTAETLVMLLGIFFGSMAWWIILGFIIVKIKHKLPKSWIHGIRYLSAVILGSFGVAAILSGLL